MENLFLVCLIPPAPIVEDIDEIRNNISEKYSVFESLKRPAHITLYNPVKISSYEQEKKFFKVLEDASYLDAFEQVLRNFSSFAPHTVYIDVVQNDNIMKLQAQIKAALKPLNIIPAKDVMKFTPHLTIAFKDVKLPVYQLIMDEYKDKNFKRTFTVSGFSVYKHLDKRWRPYKEFPFKNPDGQPKALSLFD
ncbi:2'-5' RNA ligase family protein [Pedobacter rhodius]|uniref:2'-5' RNA ligase family protein n=1 Tax=Pedobacter rhodius TaxID=3004098 RepID=A0ABT4KT76_9SPHI|nr:2'-5' RNA ligase family protein [Pedobacter sp. SJ11]MCZ4222143.1 2'-5' RNA ligase family protein [Pedobacter sp. SJ11]